MLLGFWNELLVLCLLLKWKVEMSVMSHTRQIQTRLIYGTSSFLFIIFSFHLKCVCSIQCQVIYNLMLFQCVYFFSFVGNNGTNSCSFQLAKRQKIFILKAYNFWTVFKSHNNLCLKKKLCSFLFYLSIWFYSYFLCSIEM